MANPKLVTAPVVEPVTVEEAKYQLRVTGTDEDSAIENLVAVARAYVEARQARQLLTATYDFSLEEFAEEIELPRPPLQSVTSIKYIDENGVEQTVASTVYRVDAVSEPGIVYLDDAQSWPTPGSRRLPITVRFVAGHAKPQDVPEITRQAILYLVEGLYSQRSPVVTGQVLRALPAFEAMLRHHEVTVLR